MTGAAKDNVRPAEMFALELLAAKQNVDTTTIREWLKSGHLKLDTGHMTIGGNCHLAREAGLLKKYLEEPEQEATVHPSWFTRDETARLLNKTVKTVDRYRKSGLLKDLDFHGAVRISRESVERLLRRPIELLPDQNDCTVIYTKEYQKLKLDLQHYKTAAEKLGQVEAAHAAKVAECTQLQERIRRRRRKNSGKCRRNWRRSR